jgi:TonB family protein
MSSQAVSAPVSQLVRELFDQRASRSAWTLLGWGVALGAHLLAASLALTEHRPTPRAQPPLEVELAPPAPTPAPAPVALPTPPEPRVVEHLPVARAAAPAPEPAHVGALVTAKTDPAPSPNADEPVDFTNDPGALGFGSGIVAIGGKAEVGAAHAVPGPRATTGTAGPAPRATGDALTPASDLSQKPSLGEGDPCRGYFPAAASDDVATAAVLVTIAKSGAVSDVQLLHESPPKQGFGAAAKACMASKRFTPGLDRDGNRARTAIRVNIRFVR